MLGHLNLGMTLAATGAYDKAVRTFQRARELAPSFLDSLALLGSDGEDRAVSDGRARIRGLTGRLYLLLSHVRAARGKQVLNTRQEL